jgi:hypothetical protein
MKYSALIVCAVHGALPAFELTARDDNAAVDDARKKHQVPDEGGDYEIAVSCLEPFEYFDHVAKAMAVRPAGAEVSRFGVSHEPQPHVAEAVYAQREADALAKAEAEKRAQIENELLERLGLKLDASGKAVPK